MNIALLAHNSKKELMEAFCIAYKGILEKHDLFSTSTTGYKIMQSTDLNVHLYSPGTYGQEQIAARVAYNEIDLVIFFVDTNLEESYPYGKKSIHTLCDINNIPFASNIATAEILINGVQRGDFAWRDNVRPQKKK